MRVPVDTSGASSTSGLAGRLQLQGLMVTILLIVLLVALLGGGLGYSRFGYAGMSPAAIVLIILLVLLLMGRL